MIIYASIKEQEETDQRTKYLMLEHDTSANLFDMSVDSCYTIVWFWFCPLVTLPQRPYSSIDTNAKNLLK